LRGIHSDLPGELYVWRGSKSYTGQDMAELHVLSCQPLVELLLAEMMSAGARAALPGEFTLRAFLAGKMDLTRAEAVLGVINATDAQELKQALAQLAGGMVQPLSHLREELVDLLADVEAGLDFTDEDIQFVEMSQLLSRLTGALAQLTLVQKQLLGRSVRSERFRVVFAGPPNAGKSSLFNALAGRSSALVSPQPGTTRDYLVHRLSAPDVEIDLIDTAGWDAAANTIEEQSQSLGHEQRLKADLVLICLEAGMYGRDREAARAGDRAILEIITKCDLCPAPPGRLATSAVTGEGIDELRRTLVEHARRHGQSGSVPGLSRCRHHVESCLTHLRRAHDVALNNEPAEMLALELRSGLEHLGEMTGAVYTDELLDRIFSRFCIGK
jgi:tRNA modification GTPase